MTTAERDARVAAIMDQHAAISEQIRMRTEEVKRLNAGIRANPEEPQRSEHVAAARKLNEENRVLIDQCVARRASLAQLKQEQVTDPETTDGEEN